MTPRRRLLCTLVPVLAFATLAAAPRPKARNVVLFIGDAGGIPTLHAASVHAYGDPQKLFIQRMAHIGLMDTSSATEWVSDSAAAMTAIVTGQKTVNGVLSQSASAVRGQRDGAWLKTILEEAEERGLSTGIITNTEITDATPAACYAHVNSRGNTKDIVRQLLDPRAGNGVDVVIGGPPDFGPKGMAMTREELGARFAAAGYVMTEALPATAPSNGRIAALVPEGAFELQPAIDLALAVLRKNPRGYFLMVEWDNHADVVKRGLERVATLDAAVERMAATGGRDTLVVFAADHSFDIRLRSGRKGSPIVVDDAPAAHGEAADSAAATPRPLRVDDGHTGEQVLVAAQGPGAEAVRGFLVNTDLFRVMRQAYGWDRAPVSRTSAAAPVR